MAGLPTGRLDQVAATELLRPSVDVALKLAYVAEEPDHVPHGVHRPHRPVNVDPINFPALTRRTQRPFPAAEHEQVAGGDVARDQARGVVGLRAIEEQCDRVRIGDYPGRVRAGSPLLRVQPGARRNRRPVQILPPAVLRIGPQVADPAHDGP